MIPDLKTTRLCTSCGNTKPLSAFDKHRKTCHACRGRQKRARAKKKLKANSLPAKPISAGARSNYDSELKGINPLAVSMIKTAIGPRVVYDEDVPSD